MNYPIHFVSLGPGEADLITLKGYKILQNADIIYCPSTAMKDSICNESRALRILKELEIDESKIRLFKLPMSKKRADALSVYNSLHDNIMSVINEGNRIAIVAEGDAGFYSSIQYLYDKLKESEIRVERVAGIPAFIAAGAYAGFHIAKQEEQLIVIPGIVTAEELSCKIKEGKAIVIMKLSQCIEAVHTCIQLHPETSFHYFENVGTEREYYTSDKDIILKTKFPYFSLMIIQTNNERNGEREVVKERLDL